MVSSCLDPTEIMVDISTNVACDFVTQNGVAIAVGAPGEDDSGITTATSLCNPDGNIGSLVITPSGGSNQAVGIRVTRSVLDVRERRVRGCGCHDLQRRRVRGARHGTASPASQARQNVVSSGECVGLRSRTADGALEAEADAVVEGIGGSVVVVVVPQVARHPSKSSRFIGQHLSTYFSEPLAMVKARIIPPRSRIQRESSVGPRRWSSTGPIASSLSTNTPSSVNTNVTFVCMS